MNVESHYGLARRTAMHAALADPARLRITDTLADGDASPSELAAMLAMPSNLMAHHLRVLEEAGMLTRHRSEGDRRRTYLRLVPGALDELAGTPGRTAPRGLFVCTANSARSHLAAALWRRASGVPAASAGTPPARADPPRAIRPPDPPPRPPPAPAAPAPAPARQRHEARRRPHRDGLRPGPRATRRTGRRALVRARPRPGRRPGQLRRRPGRTEPPGHAARPAPGRLLIAGRRDQPAPATRPRRSISVKVELDTAETGGWVPG